MSFSSALCYTTKLHIRVDIFYLVKFVINLQTLPKFLFLEAAFIFSKVQLNSVMLFQSS